MVARDNVVVAVEEVPVAQRGHERVAQWHVHLFFGMEHQVVVEIRDVQVAATAVEVADNPRIDMVVAVGVLRQQRPVQVAVLNEKAVHHHGAVPRNLQEHVAGIADRMPLFVNFEQLAAEQDVAVLHFEHVAHVERVIPEVMVRNGVVGLRPTKKADSAKQSNRNSFFMTWCF